MTKEQALYAIDSGNRQIAAINKSIAKATAYLLGETSEAQSRGGANARVRERIYSKPKKASLTRRS